MMEKDEFFGTELYFASENMSEFYNLQRFISKIETGGGPLS